MMRREQERDEEERQERQCRNDTHEGPNKLPADTNTEHQLTHITPPSTYTNKHTAN